MKKGHRRMPAYGEREHGGRYILDDYTWSRNHTKAGTIRRWKRNLKKKAEPQMQESRGGVRYMRVIEKLKSEKELCVTHPLYPGRYIKKSRAIEIVEKDGCE